VVAIDPSPLFKLQKHGLINIIQSKTVNWKNYKFAKIRWKPHHFYTQ
jgi:hypothetical protein